MSFVIFIATRHALLASSREVTPAKGGMGGGGGNLLFRAGLPVYVYVWATRLYDFCLIAAANKQAPLVTHIEREKERGERGGFAVKRLWRSSGKLNLSLEHAKRTPNRPLVFIFTPFANSMENFCRQISLRHM